ncbi:unnamed protein product [Sphagnum balticum]
MMEFCPVAADQQATRLDEFVLVSRKTRKAKRGAHASSPMDRKSPPTANGSFAFASPEFREAPSKLISFSSGDAIGKEGGSASSIQAILVAFQDRSRLQQKGKEAQASPPRNDGDGRPRRKPSQRSASPFAPLDVASKIRESKTESSGDLRTH